MKVANQLLATANKLARFWGLVDDSGCHQETVRWIISPGIAVRHERNLQNDEEPVAQLKGD
jgi:hypothetical protein